MLFCFILQMNSLENYIIGPSSETAAFLDLSEKVLNLDRRDFELGYNVDESKHPKRGDKEASSSGKGKRPRESSQANRGEDITKPFILHSSSEDEDIGLPGSQVPVTPHTGLGSCSQPNEDGETHSSDSSMPDPSPVSKPGKKKRKEGGGVDLAEALFDRLSDKMMKMEERTNQLMFDMMERQRKADEDKWTFLMTEKIPSMVKTLVAECGPRPMMMLDPAHGHGGPLLLSNRPANSSDSGAATRQSPSAPVTRETSSASPAPASNTAQTDEEEDRSQNDPCPDTGLEPEVDITCDAMELEASDVPPGSSS